VIQEEIPTLNRNAKSSKFKDFAAAVEAMRAGTQVVFTGPGGDYILMAEKLRNELGLTEEVFTYVPVSSGKDGLTSVMGGHADFALALPSTSLELIESGDIAGEWVYNDARYTFGGLTDLPTYKEYMKETLSEDVADIKWAIYRIVVASANMSDEAAAYWLDCLEKACATPEWEKHVTDFSCNSVFITGDAVKDIW
jgi:tripartite-type tricarboxylate transporter receptor subunit TctC